MNNPNIIKIYQVFETQTNYYLILELCRGGTLSQKLKKYGKLQESQKINILKGILKGIEYVHTQKIMHRDLKIENIMFLEELDQENCDNIKITDFGLATSIEATSVEKIFKKCGTPGYISPEILNAKSGQTYNEKCDIFSIGVIFHLM